MNATSLDQVLRVVPDDAEVLDVGGWAKPFRRANWVIDLNPHETRGELGFDGSGPERFTRESWVEADICARQPWPFTNKQFDFVVCSHTLEDLRDPIWVCSELVRVAKAGYIETPSRLEEQCYGFQGPWVGWGHHHWLVEARDDHLEFVFKHHVVHGRSTDHFPPGFHELLSEDERVLKFFWVGAFSFEERVYQGPGDLDVYLSSFVRDELEKRGLVAPGQERRSPARRAMRHLRAVSPRRNGTTGG